MCRAVYPHELNDQDFEWLVNSFLENHPEYICVECNTLPIVLLNNSEVEKRASSDKERGAKYYRSDQQEPM